MKKIILSALMAAMLIFAGCKSGGGDNPKTVLMSFFDALAKKDFDAVKKYTTKDSESMLGMVQMGMQNMPDTSQTMMYKNENIEVGDAAITGDKAIIPVKDKKSGETTDFTLKKEGGQWKVAFDKSTIMEMAQKKMKEHGFNGMHHRNDSLNSINGSNQNIDSTEQGEMRDAQKMMDSANKMLNRAKDSNK